LKRSTRKNEQKAKRQSKKRSTKRGFRKLVVDGAEYLWRIGKRQIEIRVPGPIKLKWIVPRWRLHGYNSELAFDMAHEDVCHEGCCGWCSLCCISPGIIREYIDKQQASS
jgi:hypothetical protein